MPARTPMLRKWPVVATGMIAYAVVAAMAAPFTWPARIATGLPIVAAAAVAVSYGWLSWRLDVPVEPRDRAFVGGVAIWLTLLVIVVGVQVLNYVGSPRSVYPTLSSLVRDAFTTDAVRAGSFALWLALGWYLSRR